ncbi:MAG: riboflavin synthase [Syntrophorhabdaceae bacterium]|nr:riboflavin synthase [Syntrophorhabdaceae bacterium]
MFTGIIEDIGIVEDIRKSSGKWEFRIKTVLAKSGIREGDSVAIDGVCLTSTRIGNGYFFADASLETLNLTTLREKKAMDRVNIERAMEPSGRFGGHFVMGHVDGLGVIKSIRPSGDSLFFEVEVPEELTRYIVKKGSIAIDGISLTVNEQHGNIFTVNIIPYTASRTTIGDKNPGDKVNIETDIIGKYVERFISVRSERGITKEFLSKYGFLKGD